MAGHNFKALQTFRAWSETRQSFIYGYHCNICGQDYIITDGMILYAVVVKTSHRDKTKPFELCEKKEDHIAIDHNEMISVVKESIGIYIGKDDATKWEDRQDWLKHIPKEDWTGVPIFAGLPEDGNIGGDVVEFEDGSNGYLKWNELHPMLELITKKTVGLFHESFKVVVSTSQYEQHLKETKCR